MQFDDVSEIWAKQADAITIDENVIYFNFVDGRHISIGETALGLKPIEDVLRWFGIESDWYSQLEISGVGTTIKLYDRD